MLKLLLKNLFMSPLSFAPLGSILAKVPFWAFFCTGLLTMQFGGFVLKFLGSTVLKVWSFLFKIKLTLATLVKAMSYGFGFIAQALVTLFASSHFFNSQSVEESILANNVEIAFGSYFFMPDYSLFMYFLTVATVIALLLLALPLLLKPTEPGFEKNSSYECGFEPFVCKNESFESHFLIVGVLFLLFDLELIFLFPLAAVASTSYAVVLVVVLPFLFLLLLGFIFEWVRGALLWPVFYARRSSVFDT